MGTAMCCTTVDQKREKPINRPTKVQEQLPITLMASKEAPGGPIIQPVVEVQSLNQPEDEPVLQQDTEEKLSEKFKTEQHGEFYMKLLAKWEAKPDLQYVTGFEMSDGIYSGYILQGKRHGAGTLVDKNYKWRMEGIWCDDKGFIETGQKEFNDGEVKTGRFVNSRYQEVKAPKDQDIQFLERNICAEVQAQTVEEIIPQSARADEFANIESVRSEGGSDIESDIVRKNIHTPNQGPILSILKIATDLQLKSEARQQQRQYKSSSFSDRNPIEPAVAGPSLLHQGRSQANPVRSAFSQAAVIASQSGRSHSGEKMKSLGMNDTKTKAKTTTHSQMMQPISYPRPDESPYPPLIDKQEDFEKPMTEKSAPHDRLEVNG